MPTNHELQVKFTLKDEISQKLAGVQGAIQKLANKTKDMALEMRKIGREMSYVGMSMAAVGTAITAPLALAYKTAGNFNTDIAHQLRQTQNVFNNLSLSIGKSLLPVMRQLTDSVANAVGWWNNLEQATRDKIIQNIWNLGKSLIALGVSLVVIGKTLSALANLGLLIANFSKIQFIFTALMGPIGWVTTGFVLLTLAMLKWKAVADTVMNTAQNFVKNFTIWGWMAKLFGGKGGADKVFGKAGDWAKGVDDLKQKFTDFSSFYKEIMGSLTAKGKGVEDSPGGFWSGFEKATGDAMDKLRDFQQLGIDVANQLTTSLAGAFSSFINDAFSGQLKRAKDYFAEFGKSIANMFAQKIAEMAATWLAFQAVLAGKKLIGSIIGLLGSASSTTSAGTNVTTSTGTAHIGGMGGSYIGHKGGLITTSGIKRYHSGGLAGDEVPIIAQTGERILSRKQNAEYEKGGGQTINYYIYAMDASSFSQMLYKNKGSVHAIVTSSLKNNSGVRGAVKTYG